jgi:hypothetical protein
MLGGWFGRQTLKNFLGAIDFMAPEVSGQTKIASKLSLTMVCPQDLIDASPAILINFNEVGRILWLCLVMSQSGYFAI